MLFLKQHLLANEWGRDEWVKEPKETQGKYEKVTSSSSNELALNSTLQLLLLSAGIKTEWKCQDQC